ncbi:CHAP domain-containing protein [Amycolatopsis sp. NPDC004378]
MSWTRWRATTLTLLLATASALFVPGVVGLAHADSCSMTAGQQLNRGQELRSADQRYKLVFQGDANLVEYDTQTNAALWASNTTSTGADRFVLQNDRNLVLYAGSTAVWASNTSSGDCLIVQNDGNVVLYQGGSFQWANAGTAQYGSIGRNRGDTVGYNYGAEGQCTWGAFIEWHNATGAWPYFAGATAAEIATTAGQHGWTTTDYPYAKSIVVFQPGVYGASQTTGHMGWVRTVEDRPDGRYIRIVEMNAPNLNQWSTRTVRSVSGMKYILAT